MIIFDKITGKNQTEYNPHMATDSRSSIQNTNNRRLWIRKNQHIIKSNISSACQRSVQIKISAINKKT